MSAFESKIGWTGKARSTSMLPFVVWTLLACFDLFPGFIGDRKRER